MTPAISAVIEQTISLQRQTNHLQLFSLILILICDVLILLSVLNIWKAIRNNREWAANLQAWSDALAERDSDTRPKAGDAKQGSTRE